MTEPSTVDCAHGPLGTERIERVQLLANQGALQNVGFAVGGLLAAVALAVGGRAFDVVVYADAGSYLVPIVLVAGMPAPRNRRAPGEAPHLFRGLTRVARDRRYLALALLDFLSNFHDAALLVALPLWVVLYTSAPHAMMGILFLLNTVIVVFAQVRISARVRHLGDVLPAAQRAAGCVVLCAAAYLGAHYAGPVAAVILLVAGVTAHTGVEMLADTGQWVASTELADPDHRGTYLAVFSLGSSLSGAIGPTLVAGVLLLGSVWLWPVLAVMIATGTLATGIITRRSAAVRPESRTAFPVRPGTSPQPCSAPEA